MKVLSRVKTQAGDVTKNVFQGTLQVSLNNCFLKPTINFDCTSQGVLANITDGAKNVFLQNIIL